MNALHLSNQLCFPFYAISKEITKRYRSLLEPLQLTYPQYLVMLVLWENDFLSLKAIGHRLHLDSGTLTPLFKNLMATGYIEKTRNREDERQLVIQLTEAGKQLERQAEHIPAQLAELLGLNKEDYLRYQHMLADLSKKLSLTNETRL